METLLANTNRSSFLKPFLSDRIQKSNLSSHSQEEESNDDTQDGNNFVESEPSTPTSVTSIETTPSVATSKGKSELSNGLLHKIQ